MIPDFYKNKARAKLLSKYDSSEYGYWKITGEPFGGNLSGLSEHVPLIGFFEGSYSQAVERAISSPYFFNSIEVRGTEYGNKGGAIKKIKIKKL